MAFIDRVHVRVRVQVCTFYSDCGTWGYVKYINLQSHRWSFRLKACDITSMGAVFELSLVCMFGTMVIILLFGRIDTCLDILRQVFPIDRPAKYHFIPSTPFNTLYWYIYIESVVKYQKQSRKLPQSTAIKWSNKITIRKLLCTIRWP